MLVPVKEAWPVSVSPSEGGMVSVSVIVIELGVASVTVRQSKGGMSYLPVCLIKENAASVPVSPHKGHGLPLFKATTFFR